jgi:hypothetical protein
MFLKDSLRCSRKTKVSGERISQTLFPVLSIISLEHNIGKQECQVKALFLFTALYIDSLEHSLEHRVVRMRNLPKMLIFSVRFL